MVPTVLYLFMKGAIVCWLVKNGGMEELIHNGERKIQLPEFFTLNILTVRQHFGCFGKERNNISRVLMTSSNVAKKINTKEYNIV